MGKNTTIDGGSGLRPHDDPDLKLSSVSLCLKFFYMAQLNVYFSSYCL